MEICPVSTIVCLVKPQAAIDKTKSQQILVSPNGQEFKLIFNDSSEQECTWDVTSVTTPESHEPAIQERKQLIDLAMQGYNVTSLSMSQGERNSTYEQRRTDLQSTIHMLKAAIQNSNSQVRLECAYVGLDDTFCFDFIKDVERPNERILQKGLDSVMKEMSDLDAIWARADTQKQGRIQLFDLLLPPFSAPVPNTSRTIYQSFSHLVNLAKASSTSHHGHLPYNQSVLTYLLVHPLCGHEKFSVFLYLNDRVTDRKLKDTVSLLDFTTILKSLHTRTLPIRPIFKTSEYKRLVHQMDQINAEFQTHEQQLINANTAQQSRITSLEAELAKKDKKIEFLKDIDAVRDKQAAYLEALYDDVSNRPNMQVIKLQTELVLQKHANKDLQFERKLLEMQCKRYTHLEIPNLQEALNRANADVRELEQALQQSAEKVEQLEQSLNESYDKCQALAVEMEARPDVDVETLEKNVQARLKAESDAKYERVHGAFKKKLESIKESYKDKIERLREKHAEELSNVREEERVKYSKECRDLRGDISSLNDKCTEQNDTINNLRESLMKAMTLKKSEPTPKSATAAASSPRSTASKTRPSSAKSRKVATPALSDDDDFVLPVRIPSRFVDTSSIANLDNEKEAITPQKKGKSKENVHADELNDTTAATTDLGATENDNKSKPKQTGRKETAVQKAESKKTAFKATTSAPSTAQKHNNDDNDDFASPVLPLESLESDTQPTREPTPVLPNLDEEKDEVSLVAPIRPKRRIRKLANPIPVLSPDTHDTSHLISRLEGADTKPDYALQPVQKQAKTTTKKQNLNTSESGTSASKRKAASNTKAKKRKRTTT